MSWSCTQRFIPFALLQAPKPVKGPGIGGKASLYFPEEMLQEPGKVPRARLLLKPLGEPLITVTLDGPAAIGRQPDLGKKDRSYVENLWKERLAEREKTTHVMPSTDGFVEYVLRMYGKATVLANVEGVKYAVSRMHLLFFPPDAFNDRWRVVDTISCWGTNINGKPVMTGKILALKHGDLLELAGKCPEFNESPLTVKFLDLAADESKYQALIVSNPEGDDSSRTARALRFKDELEKRYFSVRILSDRVKIEDLERELQLNAGACSQDATFLFAYTGHASEKGELCLHDGTYPKSRFFDGIGNFRSKNIIAIDGCFSSEFRRGNVPPRTTVITSTDGPQTSARGVLTEAIIQCFRQENGFISVDEGFRRRLIERGYFVRQTPGILERSVTVMQVRSRMAR